MGGWFGGGSPSGPAPSAPAKPYVQPAPAVRLDEGKVKKKKKRRVSGEAATLLTGSSGLTATGESKSTKNLLGD